MNLTVRPATLPDLAALIFLGRTTFVETYLGMGAPRPEGLEQRYGEATFNEAKLLPLLNATESNPKRPQFHLLQDSETPIGYMRLDFEEPPPCVPPGTWGHLAQVYVLKTAQGKGAGKLLRQEAFRQTRLASCSGLWLTVYDQNSAALEFYKTMGFLTVGSTEWRFNDQGRPYVDQDLVLIGHSDSPILTPPRQDRRPP